MLFFKPRANGFNIVGQQLPTLLYVRSPYGLLCMLNAASFYHPVACCCVLFGVVLQSLKLVKLLNWQLIPNSSFVPWSTKRSATILDPFARLAQHCWGHARALHMVSKVICVVSFPRCTAGPDIVWVVESVCTPLPTQQQCWKLLPPFARGFRLQSFE